MQAAPLPPPVQAFAPEFAGRFGRILALVTKLIAARFLRNPRLILLIIPLCTRLNRAARRFERLMARGIPAVLGLAIDEEFLKTLPAGHRYRRMISLPLHQDVRERDIDYIGRILALGKDA